MSVNKRKMSAEEAQKLSLIIDAYSSNSRFKEAIENTTVIFSALSFGAFFAWMILAWVVKKLFVADIGMESGLGFKFFLFLLFLIFVYSVFSTKKWLKQRRVANEELQQDMIQKEVIVESYGIKAARPMVEPEHNGIFYFLLTHSNKVLVLLDGSQMTGLEEDKIEVKDSLDLVKLPLSKIILSEVFSGNVVELEPEDDMTIEPSVWPEHGETLNISWDDLSKIYSAKFK